MKSNKKRILFVLAILTMALVLSCALVACNKTDTPDAPKKEFTITFDTQGGSEVKPLVLKEGETITLPSNPTKDGSVFDGWYLDSSYTQAFDSTKRIDSNMVLYAKWTILDDGKSIIASDYFDINGLFLTMNKKNYITSTEDVFDLQNKFSTSTGSGWRAFTSPNCDQPTEITTRMANVSAGWNNIYVKVENLTTYENQIYQLKIYRYPTIVYRELDDGFLEIQSVSDCGDVLFPDDKIDNITSIGDSGFSSCPSLRTLQNLPKLTNIGTSAFANCKRLTSITIPDSVTSIGDSAFSGCSGLTSITIPNSVTSIGDSAFSGCSGLTSITIPNSVTSIGDSAFSGCTGLTSVTIPNSVTSIGDDAFYGCSRLTNITIPDSVPNIGMSAFDNTAWYYNQPYYDTIYLGKVAYGYKGTMPDNTTITLKEGTLGIAEHAFSRCDGLTNIILPDGLITIGDSAFSVCKNLTSIVIPASVTTLGDYAFGGCKNLTSVTIGNGVTSLGDGVFESCKSLTSITIPASVTNISLYAFPFCSGLKNINVAKGNPKYHSNGNCLIETESKTLVLGCQTSVIPTNGSVTKIGDVSFWGCENLTNISIPDGITSIGVGAFIYCNGLASIAIPASVTSIADNALLGCSGVSSITVAKNNAKYHSDGNCLIDTENKTLMSGCKNSIIPSDGSVTSIGKYAFYDCTELTSITIPDSVTSIDKSAFSGCTGLTSVTIPGSVTSIGEYAFNRCYKLVEVYNKSSLSITAGSEENGYVAYYAKNIYTEEGKSKLTTDENGYVIYTDGDEKILVAYLGTETELTLPAYITQIYNYAFRDCTGLTSVTIPNSVTNIRNYAFAYCTELTSVTIPDSVTSIGDYAFRGCTSLTSITFPNSVTNIGDYAFEGCTSLTSITIPNSVTSIEAAAFSDCTSLTSISFNGTIKEWNAITKSYYWKDNVPATKVVCTDGTVSI